jgi:hypothetical protein
LVLSEFKRELGLAKSYASSNITFNVGVFLPVNVLVLFLCIDVLYDLMNYWAARLSRNKKIL